MLAQQLTRLDPGNIDWRMETAYAAVNLGVLYLDGSQSASALKAFDEAHEAWAEITVLRPELGANLARAWGWTAKAREALGRFEGAIEAQQLKMTVLRQLPDAQQNRDVEQLLANGAYELGRLQVVLGQRDQAEQSARDALVQIEALVSIDSANTEWLAHIIVARVSLAEIQIARREVGPGRDNLERSATDLVRLLSTDAKRNKWNIALAGGMLLRRSAIGDDRAPKRVELEAFLSNVDSAVSRGETLDAEQTQIAAAIELALGDLLARDTSPAEAQARWRATAARLQAPTAAGALPALTLLAHSRLRLGAIEDARALAGRIDASSHRHPAYADLRQRLAAAAGAEPVHASTTDKRP